MYIKPIEVKSSMEKIKIKSLSYEIIYLNKYTARIQVDKYLLE